MITKEEIGAKIRKFRQKTGKSQEELGKALSRSHAAVSDIERGITDLSVSDLSTIANFFGVSITEFLNRETETVPYFVQHRDAKNITPKEKEAADKISADFIKLARELAEEQKDK